MIVWCNSVINQVNVCRHWDALNIWNLEFSTLFIQKKTKIFWCWICIYLTLLASCLWERNKGAKSFKSSPRDEAMRMKCLAQGPNYTTVSGYEPSTLGWGTGVLSAEPWQSWVNMRCHQFRPLNVLPDIQFSYRQKQQQWWIYRNQIISFIWKFLPKPTLYIF